MGQSLEKKLLAIFQIFRSISHPVCWNVSVCLSDTIAGLSAACLWPSNHCGHSRGHRYMGLSTSPMIWICPLLIRSSAHWVSGATYEPLPLMLQFSPYHF